MKHLSLAALCLTAAPVWAESLCGVTDPAAVLGAISGQMAGDLAISIEAETLSVTQVTDEGQTVIGGDGTLSNAFLSQFQERAVPLALSQVYDVDQIDDILDTVEAPQIADQVSDTACGPEALPQMTGTLTTQEDLQGTVTLVPYFSDRVVMIIEMETTGDWGLAYVTAVALLSPT